ncbi:hypothetical protein SAMN05216559_3630 [Halomicrobium zhouii]|uniref:Uncharacterized protein n=1 Tax=Halomicrobium zhouii TaxID=767519 RepID=A0A1I6M2Q4_9EURY|nr:hypothetical protein [Halomicrobium zhouii]SFS09966.1 hypothetical protein SAMN05216559_3630 [Halomicrobium zhouii]
MANRSEKVEFYVTPDKKQEIVQAADEAETTVSTWCASRIDEILHNDALEAKSQEHQAEQRLQELIARATDEIEAAAEDLRETQIKSGVYSIATWELVKQDIGEVQRQDALSDAASRVRDTDALDIDIEVTESTAASQSTAGTESTTESATTAAADSDGESTADDGKWWNQ